MNNNPIKHIHFKTATDVCTFINKTNAEVISITFRDFHSCTLFYKESEIKDDNSTTDNRKYLLTSEDGVKMYEGDIFYYTMNLDTIHSCKIPTIGSRYFSSRQAAKVSLSIDLENPRLELIDIINDEYKKGNIVVNKSESTSVVYNLTDFIKQPVDGILYDLNRLEEVVITHGSVDGKWLNDFAVTKTIRALKLRIDELEKINHE